MVNARTTHKGANRRGDTDIVIFILIHVQLRQRIVSNSASPKRNDLLHPLDNIERSIYSSKAYCQLEDE